MVDIISRARSRCNKKVSKYGWGVIEDVGAAACVYFGKKQNENVAHFPLVGFGLFFVVYFWETYLYRTNVKCDRKCLPKVSNVRGQMFWIYIYHKRANVLLINTMK